MTRTQHPLVARRQTTPLQPPSPPPPLRRRCISAQMTIIINLKFAFRDEQRFARLTRHEVNCGAARSHSCHIVCARVGAQKCSIAASAPHSEQLTSARRRVLRPCGQARGAGLAQKKFAHFIIIIILHTLMKTRAALAVARRRRRRRRRSGR